MAATSGIAQPVGNVARLMLALILCLSALVQLTTVSKTVVDYPLRADAAEYFSYAFNLRDSATFSLARTWTGEQAQAVPDKVRSPGYPFFLASLGSPEPTDAYLFRVSLVQGLLGVLSIWLIFSIGRRFLTVPLALGVSAFASLSPHLATISTYLLTESLFVFMLLVSLLTLLRAVETTRRPAFVITGVAWGLCSLVRPTTQFFPILLVLAVFALPTLRRFRAGAAVGIAMFALVMAPWTIRNQGVTEAPGASLMVNTLAHGSYPGFMYQDRPETLGFPYRFDPQLADNTRDLPAILTHISSSFRREPFKYASWYLVGKPVFFLSWGGVQGPDILIYPVTHSPFFDDPMFAAMRSASLLLHWPMMILGLIGASLALLRPQWLGLSPEAQQASRIVALLVFYAVAFHMVVAPFPRYGVPFRPILYAFAFLTCWAAWAHVRRKGIATLQAST